MAKSQLNSSSNWLDNKRWRREKRRDEEAKKHNRWIEAKNRRDRAVQQRKEEMEYKTFPRL
jgi:hypothetical protein